MLASVLALVFVHGAQAAVSTNYWEEVPSVTPSAWREGDTSAKFFEGTPHYGKGTVVVTYSNRLDKADLGGTRPTQMGEYAARFCVPATDAYEGLVHECVFSIARVPSVQNGEGYYSTYDYASQLKIVFDGYTGETGLNDIPVYIKINEGVPKGFSYTSMRNGKDDIRFFDSTGHLLNHEIVKWVSGGESEFWVHIPLLRKGTEITMCWNLRDGCTLPDAAGARGLWSDFAGVWHMDETIKDSESSVTSSKDATGNGLDAAPTVPGGRSFTTMPSLTGVFSNARYTDKSTSSAGSYLLVPNANEQLDIGDTFTLSFWVKLDSYTGSPILVSRRASKDSVYGGFQIDLCETNRTMLVVSGAFASSDPIKVVDSVKDFTSGFTHLAFVYHGDEVDVYANGVAKATNSPIETATNNGQPMGFGNNVAGDGQSLWGALDEVRLYNGERSGEWLKAEYESIKKANFYTCESFTNDTEAVLKNTWRSEPSITKTTWTVGTAPTLEDFKIDPSHNPGTETIVFYDRATGACLGEEVPTDVGEYRAVITIPAKEEDPGDLWGSLEATVTFRIIANESHRSLGVNVDRVMLAHDDESIEGAWVQCQAYNYEDRSSGTLPYWRHLDEYGADASTTMSDIWSVSPLYNFGGGTVHEFRKEYEAGEEKGVLYWYMQHVRLGNTFNLNDGEGLEEGDEGLWENQNYLPWNPNSRPILDDDYTVGGFHQLTGQILLQNTTNAVIYSRCYEDGIGTIYFDAVNGWADNITNAQGQANYRLELQISTNLVDDVKSPPSDDDVLPEVGEIGRIEPAPSAAVWHTVPMRVLRFSEGATNDLGVCSSLTLACEDGGTCGNFYRVIAPVNSFAAGRFRIIRTAIDTDQRYYFDGDAFILLDNLICSKPTGHVSLQPCGRYFADKAGARTLGWEGAFTPAFPSVSDAVVRGRAKRVDTAETEKFTISAATMHYRWHYLEQKDTGWKVADLDPKTLVSINPLELPLFEGDVEFWFDANQQGDYYTYVDYSGTGRNLGSTGYSEEMATVTNRASGADWFVRVRPGQSDLAEMALLVKTSESATPTTVNMSLFDNDTWRGHYRMTEALEGGIYWRIESRNRQTSGSTTWQANTNYWYEFDWKAKAPDMPASGRMIEGDETSWSRMVCDNKSGYLSFQVSESTKGVSVYHSDYQDFNNWNDAAKGSFTGSSTEKGRIVGVASGMQQFDQSYAGWKDTIATNILWDTLYRGMIDDGEYEPAYKTFASDTAEQWDLTWGQWAYAKYREPTSHVAFVMRGCGMGEMALQNASGGSEGWPRGYDTISFDARVAQPVSPELGAYNVSAYYDETAKKIVNPNKMANYTFMARTCFDMEQNKGFAGNASLSLFAYYREDKGAYEARWEQIYGEMGKNDPYKETVFGPLARGQRLVISRWNKVGNTFVETELYAVTNSTTIKYDMPRMPRSDSDVDTLAKTNNLMPMCISVYKYSGKTFIVAGVRISTASQTASNLPGVDYKYSISSMGGNWHLAWVCDDSDLQLESGSYGMLSSNCKGLMLTPQFSSVPTWPSGMSQDSMYKDKTGRGFGVNKSLSNSVTASANVKDCYDDFADSGWNVNPGRESAFFGDSASKPYGIAYVAPSQYIDVYMSAITSAGAPDGKWEKIESIPITGFGAPGLEPDYAKQVRVREKAAVKLVAGGDIDDYRTDIAISNVKVSQLLGEDGWSTSGKDWDWDTDTQKNSNNYGRTNIVYTSGWVTNGAVCLSTRRTTPDYACSVRSPLMDGSDGRGSGLGEISIRYRLPRGNFNLKVQFVTNYTSTANLKEMSRTVEESDAMKGNKEWFTVTNLTAATLSNNDHYSKKLGYGEFRYSFGFHGAKGMMRLIIDNADVEKGTYGEIDILEVQCKDEPSLDKNYWWGWNMQIVGDVCDTQRRMYLPDSSSSLSLSGRALALNNSVTNNISADEKIEDFRAHMPFVQSPMFTNALIGQVSFKARKFDLSDRSPSARVVVYGAGEDIGADQMAKDSSWKYITEFWITNTIYTTFSYKTDAQDIRVLRLAVVNVPDTKSQPTEPTDTIEPQRVLIDEVMVSEAVCAVLSFGNVGAFRGEDLQNDNPILNVPSKVQQPLCEENWGIQAQVVSTMLEEEIDKGYTPRVFLDWYVGDQPWGWANWKSVKKSNVVRGHAELQQDSSSNWVYRSSYKTCPEAVMAAQFTPGQVVQYMLSVVYRTINPSTGAKSYSTNWLDTASWSVPDWYAPVDYNADADHGKGLAKNFAGFTILDSISPGWAWINEVNLFGVYDKSYNNSDQEFQYVEVCAPAEADLTGWTLRMLSPNDVYNNKVTTNSVATFGDEAWHQAPGKKVGNVGMASNMVFRCVGNKESAKMKKSDGTLDGVWRFSAYDDIFQKKNKVDYVYDIEVPIGVQLVRSSGVIEHSIVVVGTNGWHGIIAAYEPTNIVAFMNRNVPGSKFFYAGPDHCGTNQSDSVVSDQGDTPSAWTNNWACSPGRINTNYTGKVQQIPTHPMPSGEMIIVYASVDQTYGPIQQWIGDKHSTATNTSETIYLKRGGEGTNIVYRAGRWYELKAVTESSGKVRWAYKPHTREATVTIGAGVSNSINVVASAQIDSTLRDYGLTEDNPYTDSVMTWLKNGVDAYGKSFAYPDSGDIALADFISLSGRVTTNLTLTQMYWLDMDPTISNLALRAGMCRSWPVIKGVDPEEKPVTNYIGVAVHTNTKMRIHMSITNRNVTAEKKVWTPYILRGLDSVTSWDYKTNSLSWESETFKVTGILANGMTSESNAVNWVALRWFVFDEDSFFQNDDTTPEGKEPFTTEIEIVDPHSKESYPGRSAGWYDWCQEHGYTPIFNSWAIDERLKPVSIEILRPENDL